MAQKSPPTPNKTAAGRALELHQRGQLREAKEAYIRILESDPSHFDANNLLGMLYCQQGEPQKALPYYEQAVKVDSRAHEALHMLADCHYIAGNLHQAINYVMQAVTLDPQNIRYKEGFVLYAQKAAVSGYDRGLEITVLECLKTPGLDCTHLQALWYQLFMAHPANRGLYSVKDGKFEAAAFDRARELGILVSPLFLLGLEKLCVYNLAFEQFLTHLRKTLLLGRKRFPEEILTTIAVALSHYCLNNEYIFSVTAEEQQALGALGNDAAGTVLRACYVPLTSLGNAEALEKQFAGVPALAGVIRAQMQEPRELAQEAKSIRAITPVSAGVSTGVRAQYEQSPYPRWKSVHRNVKADAAAAPLAEKGAKILVAGCGTGQEAAGFAIALPGARILAVDLSVASLSYGSKKARELGLGNITFRQADILHLGSLGEKFDGISSSGVLHHMEDPLQGLRVLSGLLKPGGLMRIALYSSLARRHVTAARDAIRRGNFPHTPEGMRAFRSRGAELLSNEALADLSRASDYFYLSMYRDLLFHVQEHCFDIPGIEKALEREQLEFLEFVVPPETAAACRSAFQADPKAASLQNWHRYEQDNPDTFLAMYHFWCRKK